MHLFATLKRYPKFNIFGIDYSESAVKITIKKNKQKVREGNIIRRRYVQ